MGKFQIKYAIPLVLMAAIFSAAQSGFAQIAGKYYNNSFVVLIRMGVAWACIVIWLVIFQRKPRLKTTFHTSQWKLHLLRLFTGTGAVYCLYLALRFVSLSIALTLSLSYPLFLPIITRIWLKIPIPKKIWWAIVCGFVGIFLVLNPTAASFDSRGLIALGSGIFAAIAILSTRLLHRTETTQKILLLFFTGAVVLSVIVYGFSLIGEPDSINPIEYPFLIYTGICGAFYQIFFTQSARFAPARFLSPFYYFAVIFSVLGDWLIWNIVPSTEVYIGMGLVILGAILMTLLFPKNEVIQ